MNLSFDSVGAIRDISKQLRLHPEDAELYKQRGLLYFNQQQYREAIDDLNKVLEFARTKALLAEAHLAIGNCYQRSRGYSQSIGHYTKAIEYDSPDKEQAYFERGCCYYEKREYTSAIDDFTQVIAIDSERMEDAYWQRGRCHSRLGQNDPAIHDFSYVIEHSSQERRAIYHRQVNDELTQMIRSHPDYANAYFFRGSCYYAEGQYEEALEDFTRVIELNQVYKEQAYLLRGACYTTLRRYQEGISNYTEFLVISPEHAKAHFERGICYYELGKYVEANFDLVKARDLKKELTTNDLERIHTIQTEWNDQLRTMETAQARIEERDRIIRNQAHNIKNIISKVSASLMILKQEIGHPQIESALQGVDLIREMVNAATLSFSGSVEDFNYDARDTERGRHIHEIIQAAIEGSIGSIIDDKGAYYKDFLAQYFSYTEIPRFQEALESYHQLFSIVSSERLRALCNWTQKYLFELELDIQEAARYVIGNKKGSQLRLIILFNDLISNAVKYVSYADRSKRFVRIRFKDTPHSIHIYVENRFQPKIETKTTGIGNVIIDNIVQIAEGKIVRQEEDDVFSVNIILPNFWKGVQDE